MGVGIIEREEWRSVETSSGGESVMIFGMKMIDATVVCRQLGLLDEGILMLMFKARSMSFIINISGAEKINTKESIPEREEWRSVETSSGGESVMMNGM